MTFCARPAILGARLWTLEIVYVKVQMWTLLIITWYGSRNCTKLILKDSALTMSSLFQSCVLFLSCRLYYLSLHDEYPLFAYNTRFIYREALQILTNWNERQYSKPELLAMDHKRGPENSSSAVAYTQPTTIIYLKAVKYLNNVLRQIH